MAEREIRRDPTRALPSGDWPIPWMPVWGGQDAWTDRLAARLVDRVLGGAAQRRGGGDVVLGPRGRGAGLRNDGDGGGPGLRAGRAFRGAEDLDQGGPGLGRRRGGEGEEEGGEGCAVTRAHRSLRMVRYRPRFGDRRSGRPIPHLDW